MTLLLLDPLVLHFFICNCYDGLLPLVRPLWSGLVVEYPMLLVLQKKVQRLRLMLNDWNKNAFGNIHKVVKDHQ